MWLFIALRHFSTLHPSDHISPAASSSLSSPSISPLDGLPSYLLVSLALGCLLLAAAVAGLTLGLMSLDSTSLDIVMQSSDPTQADAARAIKPIRDEGNLLLVTLLLSNTLAAEFLPLVLDALVPGGLFSLIVSVLSLMVFGEMIPQAVCSRHPLYFGAKLIGFVKVLRFILYPVAAPIAYLLDVFLGKELGTIYSREELKNLIDVHAKSKVLTMDETTILKGTLEFTGKTVDNIMTPVENVFALDLDTVLDRETMATILRKGHSRIPLYDGAINNIVCLLLVKQLIVLINPARKEPVDLRKFISNLSHLQTNHKIRVAPAWECSSTTRISDLLNSFQEGRSHMALVYDDLSKNKDRVFLGIVTIEDIIEEILQEEIIDETDLYVDNTNRQKTFGHNSDGKYVRSAPLPNDCPSTSLNQSSHDLSHTLRLKELPISALETKEEKIRMPQHASTSEPAIGESLRQLYRDNNEDGTKDDRERLSLLDNYSVDNVTSSLSSRSPGMNALKHRHSSGIATNRSVYRGTYNGNTVLLNNSGIVGPMLGATKKATLSLLNIGDDLIGEDVATNSEHEPLFVVYAGTPARKNRSTDSGDGSGDYGGSGTKIEVRPVPSYATAEREDLPTLLNKRHRRTKSRKIEATLLKSGAVGGSSHGVGSPTNYGSLSVPVTVTDDDNAKKVREEDGTEDLVDGQ